jgi:hypothetical protein
MWDGPHVATLYSELPGFMVSLREQEGIAARALEFAILTAASTSEVITTHGFRSTFRDWSGDHTEFLREVAEAALAHAVGDKAEQAYRRSDALEERRKLMAAWTAYREESGLASNAMAKPRPIRRQTAQTRRAGTGRRVDACTLLIG